MLADRQSSGSRSPSRRTTLGEKITALGAKLSRTLSHADERGEEVDYDENSVAKGGRYSVDSASTVAPPVLYQERSVSRGREAFQSTGRGGIGNIRQASVSRDARPETGPDDFSATRGREAIASPNQVFSTGRGGAGNLHSPSRDTSRVRPTQDAAEKEVIREYVAAHENAPFSSGRGGIGNMNRSRSRDPTNTSNTGRTGGSPGAHSHSTTTHVSHAVHSTGRGGAGNIYPGDGLRADVIDEEERRRVGGGKDGYHSTGRGGIANLSNTPEPPVEHHPHDAPEYESTGRGGVGNIVHESKSRDRSQQRA